MRRTNQNAAIKDAKKQLESATQCFVAIANAVKFDTETVIAMLKSHPKMTEELMKKNIRAIKISRREIG
jgi:hypothetical protein